MKLLLCNYNINFYLFVFFSFLNSNYYYIEFPLLALYNETFSYNKILC